MAIVEKGDKIQVFNLKDQFEKEIDLGKIEDKVLLAFHPFAFTSLCLDQMRDLENAYDDFKAKGVRPLGLSVDPAPSKAAWAKFACLDKLEVLSDFSPLGQVAKDCGLFKEELNTSGRANVIVNNKGEVLWSKEYDLGQRPDLDEVFQAIENL